MAMQAAGSIGAFSNDLSGVNQFFDRVAQEKRQKQALAAQAAEAESSRQLQQVLANLTASTTRRGQDFQRESSQGQLGLGRDRLGLEGELGRGNLQLGQDRLAQQAAQFNTGQVNDLNKFFAGLDQSQNQFDTTQGYRDRALAQEGGLRGRGLDIESQTANALANLRRVQADDIPTRRALDRFIADFQKRNVDSQIKDRESRTGIAGEQLDYGKQRDAVTTLAGLAKQVAPDDPQRAAIINKALETLGSGGVQINEDTRFTDSPDPRIDGKLNQETIALFTKLIQGVPDPESRAAIGEELGVSQKIIDAMRGSNAGTTPLAPNGGESGRAVGGVNFTGSDASLLNDLNDKEIGDDGERMLKRALERLALIDKEEGRETEVADLRSIIDVLKNNREADFFTTFGSPSSMLSSLFGGKGGEYKTNITPLGIKASPKLRKVLDIMQKYDETGAKFGEEFNFLGD